MEDLALFVCMDTLGEKSSQSGHGSCFSLFKGTLPIATAKSSFERGKGLLQLTLPSPRLLLCMRLPANVALASSPTLA